MSECMSVPVERIEAAIIVVRGQKVLLDRHLAGLYAVDVKVLNQAVKRNHERFPADFRFQLTSEEVESLRARARITSVFRALGHTPTVGTGATLPSRSPRGRDD